MSDRQLMDVFHWNERTSLLIQNFLVIFMMACFSASVVQLGEHLVPGWSGKYLIYISILVSIEASYSRRAVKEVTFFTPEWFRFRIVEWVVLLVGLKLATYLVPGIGQLWMDLPLWQADFGEAFFTGEYIAAILVAFLIWTLTNIFVDELLKLVGDELILAEERATGIVEPRPEVRRRLANLVLMVGGIMIFIAALIRLEWQALWGNTPPYQGGVLNVVSYFILALVLLSLTQFSILRVHWSLQRIPLSHNLATRWLVYCTVFLVLISAIAVVLPTGYSVSFLSTMGYVLSFLMSIIGLILLILTAPLFFLLSLLGRLFGRSEPVEPPDFSQFNVSPPHTPTTSSFLELLKSLIFWAIFVGVIGYSLYHYVKQNEHLLEALRRFSLTGRLIQIWDLFKRWVNGINHEITTSIETGLRRLRERRAANKSVQGWRFINLRRLSPRQQVMFFFLALVRRGEEHGIPRQPYQTPYEYSQSLRQKLPDVEDEVASMTEQFVEALYTRHEITVDRAGFVKRCWQRVRRVLRKTLHST